jgi:Ca2+-binding EF-hand superfamily protein
VWNPSDQEINDMISEVDKDKSGKIDYSQFLVLMA